MRLRFFLLFSLAATSMSGCGDSTDTVVDAGSRDTAVELDSTADSNLSDAGLLDTNPLDIGADVSEGDAGPDAGPGNYVAVAGARCTPQSRIGRFNLRNTGAGHYLFGILHDSPRPEVGEPAEVTGACVFHEANNAPCECSGELVCTHDRERCVSVPAQVDIGVEVHADGESFAATTTDEGSGPVVSENVPLSGETFGMTVIALGATIIVEPITVPTRIPVEDELTGSYDAPESMDLTWTPQDTDVVVYSLTNINHHVAAPTFTECTAAASEGALNIPGSMLVPLSVSTGLEFQRVDSIRFAAAELPEGCVEFRFLTQ